MPQLVALFTSDAALAGCELSRVRPQVDLGGPGEVVGVGAWQDGQVVQRYSSVGAPSDGAWDVSGSEVVLLASRTPTPGQGVEASAQPFRFRQWCFAAVGDLERADAVRERLASELPDFLQGLLRGRAWEEAVFACFLAELRALGRIEDPSLDGATAASSLAAAAGVVEQQSRASGVSRRPGFVLAASNGRVLVAVRRGGQALWWRLLEGTSGCARHGGGDDGALARDHRRLRSVVLATGVRQPEGWQEAAEGAVVAVDRRLSVAVR